MPFLQKLLSLCAVGEKVVVEVAAGSAWLSPPLTGGDGVGMSLFSERCGSESLLKLAYFFLILTVQLWAD